MKEEYFWSIVIEQDLVQAGIWTIREEKVAIIATSSPAKWETDDDLVEKADNCLSEAISDFPEDAKEPSKVVFGVPASWVEDGKIKKPHLDKIRLVSQKLSLSPTGFVVLPEAIAHSIKVKEGSPLSGVVLGVGVGSLDITVFRLGNIVGTVNVGRSTSIIEDMVEGLSRFASGQNVPTRWLLYDGTEVDLESVRQELLAADWKDSGEALKFLHTPQIEVVSAKEKAEAVSIAGASEMGEIKGVEGFETKSSPLIAESNIAETKDLSPQDLGFVIDQDIKEANEYEDEAEYDEGASKVSKKTLPSLKIPSISALFSKLKVGLPAKKAHVPSTPGAGRSGKIKYALFFIPVLLVAGFIAAWMYLPKADITIYISPQNLQESEVVTLDRNVSSPSTSDLVFPARAVEVEVSSEKSVSTTGTKTVGEKSKGKITIRNGTASEEDFDEGTVLTSSGGRRYVLDEEITVPEAESPTTPGSITVSATADDIGEEFNLAADESLTVANYPKSEIDAVVSEEFTGGSSEEIQAVAESDRKGLLDSLTSELEDKGVSELQSQAVNARFVRDAVSFEVIDQNFSAAVGEETDSVSLTMTMAARGIVLPEDQINELSQLILTDQVPDGFSLRSEQVEADFELVDEIDEGVWEFEVNLSANLLPSIDIDKIKSDVAGKQPPAVQDYLSKIPGYVRSIITVSPTFPGFLGNIPRMTKNITVQVSSE